MIVAVAYQFHDHEHQMLVLDTNQLDIEHPFESRLKEVLESEAGTHALIDGREFGDYDDWGDLEAAEVSLPATIERVKYLRVDFDC